jgi:hypothetical protein
MKGPPRNPAVAGWAQPASPRGRFRTVLFRSMGSGPWGQVRGRYWSGSGAAYFDIGVISPTAILPL